MSADVKRPKRVAQLQAERARLLHHHANYVQATRLVRARLDEIEAVLEMLGAPAPDAELGSCREL